VLAAASAGLSSLVGYNFGYLGDPSADYQRPPWLS